MFNAGGTRCGEVWAKGLALGQVEHCKKVEGTLVFNAGALGVGRRGKQG